MDGKWELLTYHITAEREVQDEDGRVSYDMVHNVKEADRFTVEKVMGWIESDEDIIEDLELLPIRSYPTLRKARIYANSLARRYNISVETSW